jgi:ribosome-associated protein
MANASNLPLTSASASPTNLERHSSAQDGQALAFTIAQAADERKGDSILILQMAEVSYLADYFVIVSAFSRVQVRAIANAIQGKVEQDWHRTPRHIEGQRDASWILQDYGDVIVHILLPQEREFYNLEAFWGHAQCIPFTPQTEV